jgi:transcription initiation factor IIE alpha subunit
MEDYESDFISRIRPEMLDEVKRNIADDVRNDGSLTEAAKLAYGMLHFFTKKEGYDTYSLLDLSEIFELSHEETKDLMRPLCEKRYIGYLRRGLGAKNILYIFWDSKLQYEK